MKYFTFRPLISLLLCASMLLPMPSIIASKEDNKIEQSYYEWTMNGVKKGAQWGWDHKVEITLIVAVFCLGRYLQYQADQSNHETAMKNLMRNHDNQITAQEDKYTTALATFTEINTQTSALAQHYKTNNAQLEKIVNNQDKIIKHK